MRYIIIPFAILLYLIWSYKSIKKFQYDIESDSADIWAFLTFILFIIGVAKVIPYIIENW